MAIIHRYILTAFIRNLAIALLALVGLFLLIDFFDRIDNILESHGGFSLTISYFLYKIPLIINLMMPVAALVATLFTVGLMSKNSEITAMRASGLTLWWIARPIFITAFLLSFGALILNETLVPLAQRRVREIYNIDIKKKDESGSYSQHDFWWREGQSLYSVNIFDSRSNRLLGLSRFELDDNFRIRERSSAEEASYLGPQFGWTMHSVTERTFSPDAPPTVNSFRSLPLPIRETPENFYDRETDPFTMSYFQLKEFVEAQRNNGLSVSSYMSDLYAKISFPFVIFIVTFVALPYAVVPARSGSLTVSFLAGLVIGLSYYIVNSLSLALGRAELWPPMLSAWMATLVLGAIGIVLLLGTEAPS